MRAYTFFDLTVEFLRGFKFITCGDGYIEFSIGEIFYYRTLLEFDEFLDLILMEYSIS